MTLQEKLDCSTVIEERRMSRKDLGLLTKKTKKNITHYFFINVVIYDLYKNHFEV